MAAAEFSLAVCYQKEKKKLDDRYDTLQHKSTAGRQVHLIKLRHELFSGSHIEEFGLVISHLTRVVGRHRREVGGRCDAMNVDHQKSVFLGQARCRYSDG